MAKSDGLLQACKELDAAAALEGAAALGAAALGAATLGAAAAVGAEPLA
jgi:hypothetical protein